MATQINRQASIEFVVRPKQDLHLEGSLRKLPRVNKGDQYPCQMQKNQSFSCLFRHYAKHNGLRKDDLIFSFVDELQADQTPETVHLMPQDEIWVEHRNTKEEAIASESAATSAINTFSDQFYSILQSGAHSDLTFVVGEDKVEILAHRAILAARSQYFEAMLRKENSMCESLEGVVRTMHDPAVFRLMLEFIYTNTVRNIDSLPSQGLIAVIMLADEYLLDDLRKLAEKAATKIISVENIGRLLLLSAGHNASALREACADFVRANNTALASCPTFRQDIELNPELGLLLFESSLPKLPVIEGEDSLSSLAAVAGNKRRRIADQNSENEQDNNNANHAITAPQVAAFVGNASNAAASAAQAPLMLPGVALAGTALSAIATNNSQYTASGIMGSAATASTATTTNAPTAAGAGAAVTATSSQAPTASSTMG